MLQAEISPNRPPWIFVFVSPAHRSCAPGEPARTKTATNRILYDTDIVLLYFVTLIVYHRVICARYQLLVITVYYTYIYRGR